MTDNRKLQEAQASVRSYHAYLTDLLDDLHKIQRASKYPALGTSRIEETCKDVIASITVTGGDHAFDEVHEAIAHHPSLSDVTSTISSALARHEVPQFKEAHWATLAKFTDEIYADYVKALEAFTTMKAMK